MPIQNRILSTSHGDLYDARIKKQWLASYGPAEHEYQQFYREESIDTQDTRYSYISPFGYYQRKEFGGNIAYDGIYQGRAEVIALDKPRVINGEGLNTGKHQCMITLNKQAKAVQLQRLNPVAA